MTLFDSVDEGHSFSEQDVLLHLRRWRWVSCKVGNYQLLAMNWVVSALATIILFGFVIWGVADSASLIRSFSTQGQAWVTQNFTWLYILTQDVWVIFLIYICFSKYGSLKLGKDDEKPKFNDLTWFCMIFCCGIAVGFFLFGVGEPLYYYRQPIYWKGWAYDYNLNKVQVNDDDQRATQSIFMCFFHWGVHGWIPYILMAVNIGVVSHRWGLPMTIRSAFYPLIGEHIYSFAGDLIDATCMACTTFGVCTSLGLGVYQLGEGLRYMERYWNCDQTSAACTGYQAACMCGENTIKLTNSLLVGMIWGITALAAFSVVTGLNKGLKTFSQIAMVICLIIAFFCLFADNTSYLLNVLVQTTGFYFQYIIQVGFDCEAFQQLAYEFDSSKGNLLWGSDRNNLMAKLASVELTPAFSGSDCGRQTNPCLSGVMISPDQELDFYRLGAWGVGAAARSAAAAVLVAFPLANHIPCGTGWGDADGTVGFPANNSLGVPATTAMPTGLTFPTECPTTTYDDHYLWGECKTYQYSCTRFQALFDSSNRKFMDWWTIFYWGWWVSWGPFVGIFIATISRGRTIKAVIWGGFFLPCLFAFFWFAVFGGLAIKMQRVAEFSLDVKPDWQHGTVSCADYSGGMSTNAKNLDKIGYTMLTCQPFVTQIYDIVRVYWSWTPFLWVMLWIGLFFYFITSSDSGSYVDDLLGASGMSHPPAVQKIYWAITEGAVASILVGTADEGQFSSVLKGLRSVSICAGFPLTILMCMMVPATYRAIKYEMKDEDILKAKKFNVQLFDFFECYQPVTKTPYSGKAGKQLANTALYLFVPGLGVYKSLKGVPNHKCSSIFFAGLAQCLWLMWIVLQCVEGSPDVEDSASMSWVCYVFMIAIVGYSRLKLREQYMVWGSLMEDLWVSLCMYPFVLNQTSLMAENDGEGAPDYWTEVKRAMEMAEGATFKKVEETATA